MKRNLTFGFLLFFVTGVAQASPPIDVTRPEIPSQARKQKRRQIRDEDIVFQDVNDPMPKTETQFSKIRAPVIGRSLPGRTGRPLIRFLPTHEVRLLKQSQDGRWLAVQAVKSGRKAWVPKAAVNVLTPMVDPKAANVSSDKSAQN